MSEWLEVKDQDIEVDRLGKEIMILVTKNDSGNVYLTLTFEQIAEIYNKLKSTD